MNFSKHAIDEDNKNGKLSRANTITCSNQHGDKVTTSSKTKFDWDLNLYCGQPGLSKSILAIQIQSSIFVYKGLQISIWM